MESLEYEFFLNSFDMVFVASVARVFVVVIVAVWLFAVNHGLVSIVVGVYCMCIYVWY